MVVPVLGSRGKSLCICVLCVLLSYCLFYLFKNSYADNFCTGLKPTVKNIVVTKNHYLTRFLNLP